jgi:hypothetical protein
MPSLSARPVCISLITILSDTILGGFICKPPAFYFTFIVFASCIIPSESFFSMLSMLMTNSLCFVLLESCGFVFLCFSSYCRSSSDMSPGDTSPERISSCSGGCRGWRIMNTSREWPWHMVLLIPESAVEALEIISVGPSSSSLEKEVESWCRLLRMDNASAEVANAHCCPLRWQ